MFFALLLPLAVYAARAAWALAADPLAARRDKAIGWCMVALRVLGGVAAALLLVRLA